MIAPHNCERCSQPLTAEWVDYCGARVCILCDHHNGLTRCYCGWSESGGDGRAELEELGEVIE